MILESVIIGAIAGTVLGRPFTKSIADRLERRDIARTNALVELGLAERRQFEHDLIQDPEQAVAYVRRKFGGCAEDLVEQIRTGALQRRGQEEPMTAMHSAWEGTDHRGNRHPIDNPHTVQQTPYTDLDWAGDANRGIAQLLAGGDQVIAELTAAQLETFVATARGILAFLKSVGPEPS